LRLSILDQAQTAENGRVLLDFPDNRLLAPLFGEHDRHLARIEQALGVTIVNRGNRVAIEGDAAACDRARTVLESLYRRLESGEDVEPGDVDGAIRLSEAPQQPAVQSEAGSEERIEQGGSFRAEINRITTRNRVITPRSPMQAAYVEAMAGRDLVFGIGPAGTGKTYLAVAMAVSRMLNGEVDRIILSRPAVEAGESLGFLPGDLKEKVDPYLRPLYDALYDMLPTEQVEKRLFSGQIEIAPLAYMRGRTLANAFVILDEAQNTTPMQMKMLLTRFGEHSRMVVCGDPSQVDLPSATRSGLAHALDVLSDVGDISVVRFTERDVVRHPLVARIIEAYDKRGGAGGSGA